MNQVLLPEVNFRLMAAIQHIKRDNAPDENVLTGLQVRQDINPVNPGILSNKQVNSCGKKDMGRVDGKIAFITGAASGVGEACTRLFAREGARVVVTDINADRSRELTSRIGEVALFISHDVTSEQSWITAIKTAIKAFGRIDIIVNSAGIWVVDDNIENCSLDSWSRVMAVNLDGVFLGCKHGVGVMKRTGGGSIINISSVWGVVGDADSLSYCASKGAVRLLTKSTALYCAGEKLNIRCNSVHPGYLNTPMTRDFISLAPDPEAEREKLINLHPLARLGTAEDVAWMVLYLASDESEFVTGAEFVIDGGILAV